MSLKGTFLASGLEDVNRILPLCERCIRLGLMSTTTISLCCSRSVNKRKAKRKNTDRLVGLCYSILFLAKQDSECLYIYIYKYRSVTFKNLAASLFEYCYTVPHTVTRPMYIEFKMLNYRFIIIYYLLTSSLVLAWVAWMTKEPSHLRMNSSEREYTQTKLLRITVRQAMLDRDLRKESAISSCFRWSIISNWCHVEA